MNILASLVAQTVKNVPAIQERQETQVRSLGQEDPLEKGLATHSSILAWRFMWTEEPGGLQSMGLQRVGHNWATKPLAPQRWILKFRKMSQSKWQGQDGKPDLPGLESYFLPPPCHNHHISMRWRENYGGTCFEILKWQQIYLCSCRESFESQLGQVQGHSLQEGAFSVLSRSRALPWRPNGCSTQTPPRPAATWDSWPLGREGNAWRIIPRERRTTKNVVY